MGCPQSLLLEPCPFWVLLRRLFSVLAWELRWGVSPTTGSAMSESNSVVTVAPGGVLVASFDKGEFVLQCFDVGGPVVSEAYRGGLRLVRLHRVFEVGSPRRSGALPVWGFLALDGLCEPDVFDPDLFWSWSFRDGIVRFFGPSGFHADGAYLGSEDAAAAAASFLYSDTVWVVGSSEQVRLRRLTEEVADLARRAFHLGWLLASGEDPEGLVADGLVGDQEQRRVWTGERFGFSRDQVLFLERLACEGRWSETDLAATRSNLELLDSIWEG